MIDSTRSRLPIASFACFLFALIAATTTAYAADGDAWITKAPMPISRFGIHASVLDGRIYVIGGMHTGSGQDTASTGEVAVYDPAADAWEHATNMPTPRGFFATAVVNDRIYAIGGSPNMVIRDPGIATVEIYDPKADSWSRGADMPTPRADLTAGAVNGKIYAIGGTKHVAIEALATVEEYDPGTNSWTRKADMPTPRLHLSSAVVDGKIYVFGGSPEWPVPTSAVEAYDPATDSWTKLAKMPTERTGTWAAALNGKIYVCGGFGWQNVALGTAEEFDPKANSWRQLPDMPTPRFLLAVEAVGDKVYAIGGATTDYNTLAVVEAFSP